MLSASQPTPPFINDGLQPKSIRWNKSLLPPGYFWSGKQTRTSSFYIIMNMEIQAKAFLSALLVWVGWATIFSCLEHSAYSLKVSSFASVPTSFPHAVTENVEALDLMFAFIWSTCAYELLGSSAQGPAVWTPKETPHCSSDPWMMSRFFVYVFRSPWLSRVFSCSLWVEEEKLHLFCLPGNGSLHGCLLTTWEKNWV